MSTSPAVTFGPGASVASLLEKARFAQRRFEQAKLLLYATLMRLRGRGRLVVSRNHHQRHFQVKQGAREWCPLSKTSSKGSPWVLGVQ